MRTNRIIDATTNEIEKAKNVALSFTQLKSQGDILDLFYSDNLEEIETGIRSLNEFSSKSWLLSSILLYIMVYGKDLWQDSELSWQEYISESRARLGLDPRDVTEQLSAARFFIKHSTELIKAGWNANGSTRKLARAELAYSLCRDMQKTIKHIANDTWQEFKDWYSKYKTAKKLPAPTDYKRNDIQIKGFKIGGIPAVSISNKIPETDKVRLQNYMTKIFEAIRDGYEPAIVPVYDAKEAKTLILLRDKYRQKK